MRLANTRLLTWVFAVAVLSFLALPLPAHALYSDYTNASLAARDSSSFKVSADAVTPSIPDGSYDVNVQTSVSMFNMYDAKLKVSGGNMQLSFHTSGAWTAVYFGTAEQAHSATNAAGTDSSAYILATPAPGANLTDPDTIKANYVTDYFTIPVSALNTKIQLATYKGADKEGAVEKCMWWNRMFIVDWTSKNQNAAENKSEEKTTPSESSKSQKSNSSSKSSSSNSNDDSDSGAASDSSESESDQYVAGATAADGDGGSADEDADSDYDADAEEEPGDESESESEGAADTADGKTLYATPIEILGQGNVAYADTPKTEITQQETSNPQSSAFICVVLAAVSAALVGIAIYLIRFTRKGVFVEEACDSAETQGNNPDPDHR